MGRSSCVRRLTRPRCVPTWRLSERACPEAPREIERWVHEMRERVCVCVALRSDPGASWDRSWIEVHCVARAEPSAVNRSKRFVNTSDPGAENQSTRVSCALGLRFGSTSFRYRKLNKRRRRKLNKQNKRLRSCVSKRFANKSVIWVGTGDFGTV